MTLGLSFGLMFAALAVVLIGLVVLLWLATGGE